MAAAPAHLVAVIQVLPQAQDPLADLGQVAKGVGLALVVLLVKAVAHHPIQTVDQMELVDVLAITPATTEVASGPDLAQEILAPAGAQAIRVAAPAGAVLVLVTAAATAEVILVVDQATLVVEEGL